MDGAILELQMQLNKAQKDKILFDKLSEESNLLKKEIYIYCTKKTSKCP